jgi:hypothetical protein
LHDNLHPVVVGDEAVLHCDALQRCVVLMRQGVTLSDAQLCDQGGYFGAAVLTMSEHVKHSDKPDCK